MPPEDSTRRFSNRVDDYVRYRPDYPAGILDTLRDECGFTRDSVVADVGSGTGKLSRLFLENGNRVYGVEPNREMRGAGEEYLSGYPSFTSVDATAEETTLPDESVDFVTAGQAFHWFDLSRARGEFSRVLVPDGRVALIWNYPDVSSPFAAEYRRLTREFGDDYERVRSTNVDDETLRDFYASGDFEQRTFENRQTFDFEGLKGRLLSSSYTPTEEAPRFGEMILELRRVFERHEKNGRVDLDYRTKVYYGRLG